MEGVRDSYERHRSVVQAIVVKLSQQITGDEQPSIGINWTPLEPDGGAGGLKTSFGRDGVRQAQRGYFCQPRGVNDMFSQKIRCDREPSCNT
jgi:hypothetical protein